MAPRINNSGKRKLPGGRKGHNMMERIKKQKKLEKLRKKEKIK